MRFVGSIVHVRSAGPASRQSRRCGGSSAAVDPLIRGASGHHFSPRGVPRCVGTGTPPTTIVRRFARWEGRRRLSPLRANATGGMGNVRAVAYPAMTARGGGDNRRHRRCLLVQAVADADGGVLIFHGRGRWGRSAVGVAVRAGIRSALPPRASPWARR